MCSELCLSDFSVSLSLLLALYLCVCVCVCVCPTLAFQILSLPSAGGSRRPGTTGMWFTPTFLWLADECDCVRLPQQNCGQKVWDAWNSGDSVLPIRPNTTSTSALLISTSRSGRRTCKIPWKAQRGVFFFTSHLRIELEHQLLHISRRYLLNLSCNQKPTSSVYNYSWFTSILDVTWRIQSFNHFQLCSLTFL